VLIPNDLCQYPQKSSLGRPDYRRTYTASSDLRRRARSARSLGTGPGSAAMFPPSGGERFRGEAVPGSAQRHLLNPSSRPSPHRATILEIRARILRRAHRLARMHQHQIVVELNDSIYSVGTIEQLTPILRHPRPPPHQAVRAARPAIWRRADHSEPRHAQSARLNASLTGLKRLSTANPFRVPNRLDRGSSLRGISI
jgi:hypothetical protein